MEPVSSRHRLPELPDFALDAGLVEAYAAEAKELASSLFGSQRTGKELAGFFGAVGTCLITVDVIATHQTVTDNQGPFLSFAVEGEVRFANRDAQTKEQHPEVAIGYNMIRQLYRDTDGRLRVWHDYFYTDNNTLPGVKSGGLGKAVLYRAVREYEAAGVVRIETNASGSFNDPHVESGYIVWPVLGFEGKINDRNRERLEQFRQDRSAFIVNDGARQASDRIAESLVEAVLKLDDVFDVVSLGPLALTLWTLVGSANQMKFDPGDTRNTRRLQEKVNVP